MKLEDLIKKHKKQFPYPSRIMRRKDGKFVMVFKDAVVKTEKKDKVRVKCSCGKSECKHVTGALYALMMEEWR